MTRGIYTGANDVAFHFVEAMLRSLRVFNDLDLPVIVYDFGMSSGQRRQLEAGGWETMDATAVSPSIATALERVRTRYGDKGKHLARLYSKLVLYERCDFDEYLWLDADTIMLAPISSWLPNQLGDFIWAQRFARGPLAQQMQADTPPDIVDSIRSRLGIEGERLHLNSGVVAATFETVRALQVHAPYLVGELGEFINFADQGFLNIAAWAEGIAYKELSPRVNMAAKQGDDVVLGTDDGLTTIHINGVAPFVYHFLGYKPHPGKKPSDRNDVLVQEFYESWRTQKVF